MEHPALDILKQVQEGKRVFCALPKRTADAVKMHLWRKGIKARSKKVNGNYNIEIL